MKFALVDRLLTSIRIPVLLQFNLDFVRPKLAVRGHRLQGRFQVLELHLEYLNLASTSLNK